MVVNRLQKGLINSRIALRASRLNCQKKISNANTFFGVLIKIFILKTTIYHKCIYTYKPKIQKKVRKPLVSSMRSSKPWVAL
jgi:hypothetical protein